jgi:hypothetical protein
MFLIARKDRLAVSPVPGPRLVRSKCSFVAAGCCGKNSSLHHPLVHFFLARLRKHKTTSICLLMHFRYNGPVDGK